MPTHSVKLLFLAIGIGIVAIILSLIGFFLISMGLFVAVIVVAIAALCQFSRESQNPRLSPKGY
jgi:hypothetical protein